MADPKATRTYEDFDTDLILAMNMVYLCIDIAGGDLSDYNGFADWMVRVMSMDDNRQETLKAYTSVLKLREDHDALSVASNA